MKTIVGKVRRSGVCHLMGPIAPVNEARSARFDIWGTVIVVILLVSVVALVRLLLTA